MKTTVEMTPTPIQYERTAKRPSARYDGNAQQPAPQPVPRIAMMATPSQNAYDRTIITLAFEARELLADAEREQADAPIDTTVGWLDDATALLTAAATLAAQRTDDDTSAEEQVLRTAAASAATAAAFGKLASNCARTSFTLRRHQDFGQRQAETNRRYWVKTLGAAKADAHRALAELAELLPDAYETEDRREP
jgi:hypothetical protein